MKYLSNLSGVSFRSLWRVLTKPEMVPVRLFAPAAMDPTQAAHHVMPEISLEQAGAYRAEIRNAESMGPLNEAMNAVRGRPFRWEPWAEFVYILIRALRPKIMVETGVFDGHATAIELEALHRNGAGLLISIDLPATDTIMGSTSSMQDTTLPPGRQPGWLIPDNLRAQHRLLLGDAALLLPTVFTEFPEIDIFMHDSLHTYKQMSIEYRLAWPHIRDGGFLLSDDTIWSAAFHQFSKKQKRPYTKVPPDFGVIRK